MKNEAFIKKTERIDIERKWHKSIEKETAKNHGFLLEISSKEKSLKRQRNTLTKKLKPYIDSSKKGQLVLTEEEKSIYISALNKLSDLGSQIEEIDRKKYHIEDAQKKLKDEATENIASEIATFLNNKKLFINKRNQIEHDAEHIDEKDYLIIFIATRSMVKKIGEANQHVLLGNIQPRHLSEMVSNNTTIKFGIISDLSIYELMTQFEPYFNEIKWTIIRSLEDFDGPIDRKLLVNICTDLDCDLRQMRVLGNILDSLTQYQQLDIKHCLWARPYIKTWTQFNDPELIENWVRSPSKSWLRLEVAMETGSTFRGQIPLIDVDDLKISVLGRYFPTRYRQHKEREGTLSRCILAAKNSGFPQVIIDGLASAILNYPEDTVITVIPDKQDKRRKRMSTLLKALQSHPALKSYNFSNALLQYLPGAGTLQGMSPEQKTAHLEHYLAVKDSTQIELSAILVIDDIVTHGATLARARDVLVDNGALRVDFIAISKTV